MRLLRLSKTFAALALAGSVTAGNSNAAGIVVTDAKIENGKVVVKGTTPSPSQTVTLDGRFTQNATPASKFAFGIPIGNYLPSDCIVDLAVPGAAAKATLANCGPRGVTPRGGWSIGNKYKKDDLVTFTGRAWRAKSDNTAKQPDTNPNVWERLTAVGGVGAPGPKGPQGAKGAIGAKGSTGDQGQKGDTGADSTEQGPTGPSGAEVVSINGDANPITLAPAFAFIGPTVLVSLLATDRVTVFVAGEAKSATPITEVHISLCLRSGGIPAELGGGYQYFDLTTGFQSFAVADIVELGIDAETEIGACIADSNAGSAPTVQFGRVAGWVQVSSN